VKDLNTIVCSKTPLGALRAEVVMRGVEPRWLRRVRVGLQRRSDLHLNEVNFATSGEGDKLFLFWIETSPLTLERQYPEVLGLMQQVVRARLGVTCTIDCSGLR